MKVYLLINETLLRGITFPSVEVTEVFASEQAAIDALHEIAAESDIILGGDATSVYLPPTSVIESDEYYIESREVK